MATAKLYRPDNDTPFALSRPKVELFMGCPRCFYLDRRLGIARPAGFPFNLNSAVDALLKREFDRYRAEGAPHPLMNEALRMGAPSCPSVRSGPPLAPPMLISWLFALSAAS